MIEKLSENKKYVIIAIIAMFALAATASYGFYQLTLTSKSGVDMVAGNLSTSFLDGDAISLTNSVPISDSDGLSTNGYTFTVKNTGNVDSNYNVYLNLGTYTLPLANIKFSISSNDSYSSPVLLSTFTPDSEGKINVYSGSLTAGSSASHTIKLWIDSNSDNSVSSKEFNAVISVKSTQSNAK